MKAVGFQGVPALTAAKHRNVTPDTQYPDQELFQVRALVFAVRQELENYRKLRELITRWVGNVGYKASVKRF